MVPQPKIYRLPENWALTADTLQEKLAARGFQPCGSQDMASRGWSSPTKDDRFVLPVKGHFLISLAVEQSPIGILVCDTGGRIEYVNDAFSRITRWPRAMACRRP